MKKVISVNMSSLDGAFKVQSVKLQQNVIL